MRQLALLCLQRAIKWTDPAAFTIILESNEVHGDGFQMVQFGDPAGE